MIGQSVKEQGAGRLLHKTATAEQIREATQRLLEPGLLTAAAAAIGRRLRANSSAVIGADRLPQSWRVRTESAGQAAAESR